MGRKIILVALAVIAALCFVGCQNEAEEAAVTEISDVASLNSFIGNSEPKGTVTADFACTERVKFNSSVDKTLDLNGHKITLNGGCFKVKGGLVLCDSKGGAKIEGSGDDGDFIETESGSKLSVKDGITVSMKTDYNGDAWTIYNFQGTVDELNAVVTAESTSTTLNSECSVTAVRISNGTINNIYGGPYEGICNSSKATAYGIEAFTGTVKNIGSSGKTVQFTATNKAKASGGEEKNLIKNQTGTYPYASFTPTLTTN